MKLRGQERYWMEYLHLIAAATHGLDDLTDALAKVDAAFAKRNTDKRIKDDNWATEGSGWLPVKWDYRREGLLRYIRWRQENGSAP